MKYLIVLSMLFVGCSNAMTNEEIIKEIKKCEDAGLNTAQYENYDGTTRLIKCTK